MIAMTDRSDPQSQFWQIGEPNLAIPGVTRSTMMGRPCLRLNRDLFAFWDPRADQLVIKLESSDLVTTRSKSALRV